MLIRYDSRQGNCNYEEFYNNKVNEMICPNNDNYTEKIKEIMINYMKVGNFDTEFVIEDIKTINDVISMDIARRIAFDEGVIVELWDDDDFEDYLVEASNDIIDTLFFSNDIIAGIQEMIYETCTKYNLPMMMRKDMFFNYPEILDMYSSKGDIINSIPGDNGLLINANHAQIVMFDEFADNEPSNYGYNNILLCQDSKIDSRGNLLRGSNSVS